MLNKRRILVIGLVLLIIGLLLTVLFRSDRRAPVDWRETYRSDSRSPYGTSIFFALLKSHFGADSLQLLRDSLRGQLDTLPNSATYLFVGEALYQDSADQRALLDFVASGNTAFIASKSLPELIAHTLYQERNFCPDTHNNNYALAWDTLARLNFIHPNLRFDTGQVYDYWEFGERAPYYWTGLPEDSACYSGAAFVPIGTLNDSLYNFAKMGYGSGRFFLHTTPLVFSNFHLLEEERLAYLQRVLTHLDGAGPVYWDRYSKVPEKPDFLQNPFAERRLDNNSPLKFILSEPALSWAWYLLLALGLLFLVFRAKRQQRVIPVLEPNQNTSLEFLNMIGRLYFLHNNHRQLALQQMKMFMQYARRRYHLKEQEFNEQCIPKLAQRSGVAEAQLKRLLTYYQNIRSSSFMSDKTLAEFHQLIEHFYKNSK